MKKRCLTWLKGTVLLTIVATTNLSFVSSDKYAIVCHTDKGATASFLNVIYRSELDMHLAHGDTEVPYTEELHRSIISAEEDGAGIACKN